MFMNNEQDMFCGAQEREGQLRDVQHSHILMFCFSVIFLCGQVPEIQSKTRPKKKKKRKIE